MREKYNFSAFSGVFGRPSFGLRAFAAFFAVSVAIIVVLILPYGSSKAAGTINGRVYIDYNQNGAYDTSGAAPNYSVDLGMSGVVVTAYDSAGTQRGTTTSGPTGSYTLNATGTGPYRIEFTSLPNGMSPGAIGTNNASTVQFVPNGTTNGVDLGLSSQKTFCQNDPKLMANCYIDGDAPDGDVLIDFPYSSGSPFGPTTMPPYQNPTNHDVVLMQTQIGPTWGLAYSRRARRVYAAAYFKKHTLFGPGGPGAIYEIDPATASVTRTFAVPGATTDSHGTTNVCTGTHSVSDCDNGNTGWDAVGKTALGGMAISEDESLLYAMNLENRTLYEINRSTGAVSRWQSMPGVPNVAGSVANLSAPANLPAGAVSAANVRPFAVEYYNGKIYAGVVTSAETTPATLTNLRAHIYEVDPTSFAFTLRFSVNLDYPRGNLLRTPGGATIPAAWNAWAPVFTVAGQIATGLGADEIGFPQPMLAGIAFDEAGNMALGLRDRAGDQMGVYAPSDPSVDILYVGDSAGDTLMACGSQSSGWTIENNARCGGMGTGTQGNGQGIGGGEYIHGENWTDGSYSHDETSLGGMERIQGRPEIAATVFDPVNLGAGAFSAGIRWWDADEGDAERAYNIFTTILSQSSTFAKSNGLGDLISLCDNAPIEIGNRVWNDADVDGVQDAGEANFANVAVQLWGDTDANGSIDTQIGSATTDANGNYRFGGINNTNLMSFPCGTQNGSVSMRVDRGTDDAEQNASGNAVTTNSGDLDFLSNRGSAPNYNYVGMRFNNLSIPAGATIINAYIEFVANEGTVSGGSQTLTIQAENVDNSATFTTATNNIGARPRTVQSVPWTPGVWTQNTIQTTANLQSVVQAVVNRAGWASGNSMSIIISGAVSTAFREAESFEGNAGEAPRLVVNYSTPATCTYRILPTTNYQVRIPSTNFNTGQPLANFSPTLPDNDLTSNGDSRDSDGIVLSGTQVIAPVTTGDYGQNNHTIDFGFRTFGAAQPVYSIGNRIWYDTNNDGIISPTEFGISNISLSIFLDANNDGAPDTPGSPISTINTDANGYYRFDSLTANRYVIRVNPSNFLPGGKLVGYQNTTGLNTADAESYGAVSNSENGVNPLTPTAVLTNGLLSNTITLSANAEPLNEADVPLAGLFAGQGTFDGYGDMTVDIGFYGLHLSGTVWNDRGAGANNDNGIIDAGETLLPTIRVRLYNSTGTEIPVGADGILGTADDANGGVLTNSSGNYRFESLAPGNYRVVIDPNGAPSSTPTESNPNLNVDNNDNGFPDNTGLFPGRIISGLVTLTPGFVGAAGNNSVTNSNGQTHDPTVDFGLLFAPTQVKMAGTEAFYQGSDVVIKWTTGSESENLGFNVYRFNGGKSELLNSSLVAGSSLRSNQPLNITGSDYQWVDKGVKPGAVYYVEDIDLDGTKTMHGPIRPQVRFSYENEARSSSLITALSAEIPANQKEIVVEEGENKLPDFDISKPSGEMQRWIAAVGGARMEVSEDGRFVISNDQIRASGFDADSNSANWQLFADGVEVPVTIRRDSNNRPFVEFFGKSVESNFVGHQVYYLVNGDYPGQRLRTISEKNVEGDITARSFRVTAVRKDRGLYVSSILNGEKENWFGSPVLTGSDTVQEINAFDPDNVDSNSARLRVKLQGLTDVDHLVSVSFNGSQLGTVSLSNKENREFEFDVPMNSIADGPNEVRLRSVGSGTDISIVDEIGLRYSRLYKARNSELRFSLDAGQSARIGGFEEDAFEIYELDLEGNPINKIEVEAEKVNGKSGFSLRASSRERQFAAYEKAVSPMTPSRIRINQPSEWNKPSNGADLLILTNSDLYKQAGSLAEIRTEQGLRSRVIDVEDIYDEYNFGRKSEQAIKDFFADTQNNWAGKPGYTILFGDSSYDMRNYLGQADRDVVPSRLIDSKSLETSSDSWLVDFDDDGVEDIALGRLPAGTVAEAAAMVAKLVRYDGQAPRSSRTNLFVADTGFQTYSDTLEELLPSGVGSVKLNRSELSDTALRTAIFSEFNNSPMVVTYTGHGSPSVWAANGVFNVNDPAGLTNQKLAFVMVMTCLNGYSNNLSIDSLGEKLFKAENGAGAVWASSGSTYAADQLFLSSGATGRLFEGNMRIGDLTREAKLAANDIDAKRTWHLIGDPTSVVK